MLATTAALIGSGVVLLRDAGTVSLDGPSTSAKAPIGLLLATAGQNAWFYSIFDAYRDARVLRGDVGYKFAITRERLPDLATAPFRPSVLKRPWVWAGVPIALLAGIGVSAIASSGGLSGNPSIFDVPRVNFLGHSFSRGAGFALGEGYYAGLFGPVGIGEESLFRGLIQTELEERFGTGGGIAIASAIFGAVHLAELRLGSEAGALRRADDHGARQHARARVRAHRPQARDRRRDALLVRLPALDGRVRRRPEPSAVRRELRHYAVTASSSTTNRAPGSACSTHTRPPIAST